jgi:hypothetical protein
MGVNMLMKASKTTEQLIIEFGEWARQGVTLVKPYRGCMWILMDKMVQTSSGSRKPTINDEQAACISTALARMWQLGTQEPEYRFQHDCLQLRYVDKLKYKEIVAEMSIRYKGQIFTYRGCKDRCAEGLETLEKMLQK